jgi:hypothetical protein
MSVFVLLLSLIVGCSTSNPPIKTHPDVKRSGAVCDDYDVEEAPDINSVTIVSGGHVLHAVKLLTDRERNGFAFDGVKKTQAGFELAIEYGSRIFYRKNFFFICRRDHFYLSRIGVESFDRQNPEKWSKKVIKARPNLPLEKFSITDFMLEGTSQRLKEVAPSPRFGLVQFPLAK